MDKLKPTTRRQSLLRLSIRDVLGVTSIVALGLSLFFASREISRLKAKLDVVFPRPHIWLHSDHPLEIRYASNANYAMTGKIYPVDYAASKTVTVTAKMLDPKTGEVLRETKDQVNAKGSFGFTLNCERSLEPGFYPILVELRDGTSQVAHTTGTVQIVEASRTTD